jgi:hypothetical protein
MVLNSLFALFLACVAGLLCAGCSFGLGHPHAQDRIVGAAPGPVYTPAQIAACEKTRTAHNAWVVVAGIGGGSGGLTGGATSLSSDPNVKLGVGIGAVSLGALSLVGLLGSLISGNTFADHNCNTVLAPP